MEKRRFQRKDVTLDVKISYPSSEPRVVKTRDISDGGLFLIISQEERPIIGEVVSIELVGKTEQIDAFASSEAVVVRQEAEGVGLSFIVMDFAMDEDT